MKKVFYYLSMAAIAATLGACSSNDDVDAGENETGTLGQTFLNVRIALSGSDDGTRAATDGGYTNGSNFETTVKTANFLFYNEDGSFLTSGKLTDPNTTTESTGNNIEEKVSATVVLGPTTVKPSTEIKMLTFLNKDITELMNKSYDEVLEATTNVDYNVESPSNAEMTNSTYYESKSDGTKTKIQANIIESKDFYDSENDAIASNAPIDVYVERTIAKMGMKISSSTTDADKAFRNLPLSKDSYYYFPITSTENPSSGTATQTFVPFSVDGEDGSHFWIKVLGWCPNVVNESGYLMKKIDSSTEYKYLASTDNKATEWTIDYWNKETDHRSFWAEDANYKSDNATKDLAYRSLVAFGSNGKTKLTDASAPLYSDAYIYENTVTQDAAKYEGGEQHANVPTMLLWGTK